MLELIEKDSTSMQITPAFFTPKLSIKGIKLELENFATSQQTFTAPVLFFRFQNSNSSETSKVSDLPQLILC
jgi:hypothetical protein